MPQPAAVFIGIKGCVLALDRATGAGIWRAELRGGDFVNLAIADGDLYAATNGELYRLDTATGTVRWHNPLKGLGRGLITIASPQPGGSAAIGEKKRRDDDAAAAGAVTAAGA